jgi:acetolactate synthase-1/3 small subunit
MLENRTLSVFTENRVGLLARVTSVFTRRNVNIESLTVSESEVSGIHRFTIVARVTRDLADKMAAQLEKQVEVIKAFVHDEAQVIHRDLALYKIELPQGAEGEVLGRVLGDHGARELLREADFCVIEKTGSPGDIAALLIALEPFGVLEFVRSGSVALTRPMKKLSAFLNELEEAHVASW